MRKILVATAALATAIAFAAPANAGGNFSFNLGLGGWGHGYGHGGGIYVGTPYVTNNWGAHVNWCYNNKGPSYNPQTNTYVNFKGKLKYCNSPFI